MAKDYQEQKDIMLSADLKMMDAVDENGKNVKLVMLNDGRIAVIKKGKGRDAEEAMKISKGNQDKYMSAIMSRTIFIDGLLVIPEDLSEMDMDEYLRLQTCFAEVNF